jgi:flagellar basal-body rod modification protein FlgD
MSTIPGAAPAGTTTTPPPAPTTSNTSSGSGASNSALSLASNFNTFLSLLTTQLQNQDPTNPVDSNQFTQQLVEFAGVQQQVEGNAYLQQILAAVQGSQVGSASSYIGTSIQATGNQAGLTKGGSTTFGYNLASAASKVNVTITDSSGNVVFQGTGTGNSGQNTVTWNGTDSFTGATEPTGVYTINVTAADSSGNTVTATPFITGTVQSASISNGTVELNLGGGLQVPTTSVTSINNLPGASSGSGLSSELASLQSEISQIPSEISSGIASALSSVGL